MCDTTAKVTANNDHSFDNRTIHKGMGIANTCKFMTKHTVLMRTHRQRCNYDQTIILN